MSSIIANDPNFAPVFVGEIEELLPVLSCNAGSSLLSHIRSEK
jgi:hypothetical protein